MEFIKVKIGQIWIRYLENLRPSRKTDFHKQTPLFNFLPSDEYRTAYGHQQKFISLTIPVPLLSILHIIHHHQQQTAQKDHLPTSLWNDFSRDLARGPTFTFFPFFLQCFPLFFPYESYFTFLPPSFPHPHIINPTCRPKLLNLPLNDFPLYFLHSSGALRALKSHGPFKH